MIRMKQHYDVDLKFWEEKEQVSCSLAPAANPMPIPAGAQQLCR